MTTVQKEAVVSTEQHEKPLPGVECWRNSKNGFFCIDLEYLADPRKRSPEWLAQTKSGMPTAEFNREYGKSWIVYDGKPVYQDFDEELHVMRGNIIVPRRTKLIAGWDGGPNDVNLAWALGVLVFDGLGVIIIDELQTDNGDVPSFVEIIHNRYQIEWLKLGGFSLHFTDPSVFTQNSINKKAMSDIMREYGMAPNPSEISFGKRRAAVNDLLLTPGEIIAGRMIPRLRVHERCPHAIEGFKGGYHYRQVNAGVGGTYSEQPEKNQFSHKINAIEYLCARLSVAAIDTPYASGRLPASGIEGL